MRKYLASFFIVAAMVSGNAHELNIVNSTLRNGTVSEDSKSFTCTYGEFVISANSTESITGGRNALRLFGNEAGAQATITVTAPEDHAITSIRYNWYDNSCGMSKENTAFTLLTKETTEGYDNTIQLEATDLQTYFYTTWNGSAKSVTIAGIAKGNAENYAIRLKEIIITYTGEETGIEQTIKVDAASIMKKVMKDGRMTIVKGGTTYDLSGREVK